MHTTLTYWANRSISLISFTCVLVNYFYFLVDILYTELWKCYFSYLLVLGWDSLKLGCLRKNHRGGSFGCLRPSPRGLADNQIELIFTEYRKLFMIIFHCYHPSTKLRKGNVFNRVCLSFCSHGIPVQGPGSSPLRCTGPWSHPPLCGVPALAPSLYRVRVPTLHSVQGPFSLWSMACGRLAFEWNTFLFADVYSSFQLKFISPVNTHKRQSNR